MIDPRESWGQMASRILNFEPAPIVERSALPPELQPQNRWIGQVRQISNFQELKEAKAKNNEPENRKDLQLIKMDEENIEPGGFGNLEVQPLSQGRAHLSESEIIGDKKNEVENQV